MAEQNMEISDQINSATGGEPTSGLLKRKLSTVVSNKTSLDSNNAGSDEATSNKRRKSSRTSASGMVCVFYSVFFHPTRFHLLIKMHDGFRKEIVCNFNVTD